MWLLVIVVALAIYLATGNVLLSSLLPYLSAARPAFRSATWLWEVDPDRARARACFWFYLATAAWRAAVAALISIGVMFLIGELTARRPAEATIARVTISLFVGLALTTLIGWVAVAVAWRARVCVFVIPRLESKSGRNFSAIAELNTRVPVFNHVMFVLTCSLFVPVLLVGVALAIIGIDVRQPAVPNGQQSLLSVLGLGIVMIGWVPMLPIYGMISRRLVARRICECWPELEEAEFFDAGELKAADE